MERRTLANAIRVLSIDAIEKANSGHPGAPLGMADMAEVLWNDFLIHNPKNPNWSNRDRFILSNGHASMLLYSLLHLTGYGLTIDDIKNFRQLNSKTAGHPEYGFAPGVETTTGPLGQGLSNAVGFALAEKMAAAEFNRPNFEIVNHYTYVFTGDGCLMEGISHEAASLAGTLRLGKLIVLFDDNGISIDGNVVNWFSENTADRFKAYGWHVIENIDGHNSDEIKTAIETAKQEETRPSFICCKTIIGYGSPKKAGSESSHGSPLGIDEARATKEKLGWNFDAFVIPNEIYDSWNAVSRGEQFEANWNQLFNEYKKAFPELAAEYERRSSHKLPASLNETIDQFLKGEQPTKEASRKTSQRVIATLKTVMPELVGGSADLTGSNLTNWPDMKTITPDSNGGEYIHFGVREFGMAGILNGMYLHGLYRPFGGTFLVFSDYMRNGIRLSALMKIPVIYVMTHDSVGLGEDGPTHQPIEHVSSLRMIPDLEVWRPATVEETTCAWLEALKRTDGPSLFALSRSNIEFNENKQSLADISKGAVVAVESPKKTDQLIIATGSELPIAIAAAKQKNEAGGSVRVISMPCVERFEKQSDEFKQSILNVDFSNRFVIEAAHPGIWTKYAPYANIVAIESFGVSAPGDVAMTYFKITVDELLKRLVSSAM